MIILTADGADFWDDRSFPLRLSPGVILIKGRTARDKMTSLIQAFDDLELVVNYRREPGTFEAAKIRACATSTFVKFVAFGRYLVRFEIAERRGEGRRARSVPPL